MLMTNRNFNQLLNGALTLKVLVMESDLKAADKCPLDFTDAMLVKMSLTAEEVKDIACTCGVQTFMQAVRNREQMNQLVTVIDNTARWIEI